MRKMTTPFSAMSPALLQVLRRLSPFLGRVMTPATIISIPHTFIPAKLAPSPAPDRGARIQDWTGCRSNKPIRTVACLFGLLWLTLLIGGCAKPVPAWFAAGHQQLESFKTDFLTGAEPRLVELRFNKVLRELKKSGDLDLLQKAWLTQMALQAAALEKSEAGDYLIAEAALTIPANRQFYLFLTGDPAVVDATLLPEAYRPFWTALKSGNAAEAVKKSSLIEDPLSRLIAAG
jgi:hypothetical protein